MGKNDHRAPTSGNKSSFPSSKGKQHQPLSDHQIKQVGRKQTIEVETNLWRFEFSLRIEICKYRIAVDEPGFDESRYNTKLAWELYHELLKQHPDNIDKENTFFDGKHEIFSFIEMKPSSTVEKIEDDQTTSSTQRKSLPKNRKIGRKKKISFQFEKKIVSFNDKDGEQFLNIYLRYFSVLEAAQGIGNHHQSGLISMLKSHLSIQKCENDQFLACQVSQKIMLDSEKTLYEHFLLDEKGNKYKTPSGLFQSCSSVFEKKREMLKGRKIKLIHLKYPTSRTIDDITRPNVNISNTTFNIDGDKTRIMDYYQRKYKLDFEDLKMPLVKVKRKDNIEYYPLSVCRLIENQEVKLDENTSSNKTIQEFNKVIEQMNKLPTSLFSSITGPVKVQAKILDPPSIMVEKGKEIIPYNGFYQLKAGEHQFIGSSVSSQDDFQISMIYPTTIKREVMENFRQHLHKQCQSMGCHVSTVILKEYKDDFLKIKEQIQKWNTQNTIFLIVLQDRDKYRNKIWYESLKTHLDSKSIASQCIKQSTLMNEKRRDPILINLVKALHIKFPSKIPPKTHRIRDIAPRVTESFTFIGMDVNHGCKESSEAAISISRDKYVTTFKSTFRSQGAKVEKFEDKILEEMLYEVFDDIEVNGNVVIIRDGISDSQFENTGKEELNVIESFLNKNPRTKNKVKTITYLVIQKRCKTVLMQKSKERREAAPPGTFVDHKIVREQGLDFYLIPHKSPRKDAKPLHIRILKNGLNFTPEQFGKMITNLCYLHPGCTQAVSLPVPLLYAHKLAYRVEIYKRVILKSKTKREWSELVKYTKENKLHQIMSKDLQNTLYFF